MDKWTEEERDFLRDIEEQIEDDFTSQGIICIKLLQRIAELLRIKVCLEQEFLPSFEAKLDTIIEQLNTKIALETPPVPTVECCASIFGEGEGQVTPGQTGNLNISVCFDCPPTVLPTDFFVYEVFSGGGPSVREVRSININTLTCNVNPDTGDGTINMTGTALIRTGVGGQFKSGDFDLTLNVDNFNVVSFTINADNITDTVTGIPSGDIEVVLCL